MPIIHTAQTEHFTFLNKTGVQLAGTLYHPHPKHSSQPYESKQTEEIHRTAIVCHCFTGSKDLITTARIAKGLARANYHTLAFDFTGHGESGCELASTNVSIYMSDILAASDTLTRLGWPPVSSLVGHSLGGVSSILAALYISSVTDVVAVASPSTVDHVTHFFSDQALAQIYTKGVADIEVGTRSVLLSRGFLTDISNHDLRAAARRLVERNKRLLVVQAGADAVVERRETEQLATSAGAYLQTVDGADHLFTSRAHSQDMVGIITKWLALNQARHAI